MIWHFLGFSVFNQTFKAMTIVRKSPQHYLPGFNGLLDQLFQSDGLFWPGREELSGTLPPVNVIESPEGFSLELAAPGLSKEDFKIEINHNVLSVSAEKKEGQEEKEGSKFTRREFSFHQFKRSFTLPTSVETEQINAEYRNGLLTLSLPKKEAAKPKGPRQIEIA